MVRFGFRARLLLILALFAAVPAIVVTGGWIWAFNNVVPMVSGRTHWDRIAATGTAAIAAARGARLTPAQSNAINEHEAELAQSLQLSRRLEFLSPRVVGLFIGLAAFALLLLAWPTSRVAGHLSRQLSRPLDELVGWTERIARGEALPPDTPETAGAREFAVLRAHMRSMAEQLEAGRVKALETERLRAFRESSRQFAHELKNPLTPIRFAISRLRRDAPAVLNDTISVLATESERLEAMARSFAQFGRLPEGPAAEIDVSELVTYAARATVPDRFELVIDISGSPVVRGHYDSLSRALSNVLVNAVEACGEHGRIRVSAQPAELDGAPAVRIAVSDSGAGIALDRLATIWDPYVTDKTGGTGLGLAIVRQAIDAHGGRTFASNTPGNTEIGFLLPVNAGLPSITGEFA